MYILMHSCDYPPIFVYFNAFILVCILMFCRFAFIVVKHYGQLVLLIVFKLGTVLKQQLYTV